jgi:hypothetical protein
MNIIEMTTKDLEHYMTLVDKAVAGFERLTSTLKENLLWIKCYQTGLHATEKSFVKGRICQCCSKLQNCLILRYCYTIPTLQ